MIIIDGQQSEVSLAGFNSLNEVLNCLVEKGDLASRVITDVFINQEVFSELYPYQAEDIPISTVQHLELRSVSAEQLAADICQEMPKVLSVLELAARNIADLLRQAEIAEAMELIYDLTEMYRNFLDMFSLLQKQLGDVNNLDLAAYSQNFGELLDEVNSALLAEDWVLVADLLEYEFIPKSKVWQSAVNFLRERVQAPIPGGGDV